MVKAIRVYNGLFSPHPNVAGLKAGDLIACCNFLEFIRNQQDDSTLQLYLADEVIFPGHVRILRDWLAQNTNYITINPTELVELDVVSGTDPTYSTMYNIWNIRQDVLYRRQNMFDIPDHVVITRPLERQNKIVIAPLMDADYNFERNWSLQYLQNIIETYPDYYYHDYILACKEPIKGLELNQFQYCHNYRKTLDHIVECLTYVGGDTGLSHFASALHPRPTCEFHYSKNTYGTTNPFYWKSEGNMIYY